MIVFDAIDELLIALLSSTSSHVNLGDVVAYLKAIQEVIEEFLVLSVNFGSRCHSLIRNYIYSFKSQSW